MVFWICILIAVLFAFSAIKLGFYHTWTMLFNLLVAVYIAVRVGPFLEDYFPAAIGDQYARALALLITGVVSFLILHGTAAILLIGQFEVSFPRVVNLFGSGILGFIAGFLICSFATLIICTTPICRNQFVTEVGLDTKTFEQAKMQSYLASCCNFMDTLVGSGSDRVPAVKAIEELMKSPAKKAPEDVNKMPKPADVNEPNELNNLRRPPSDSIRRAPSEIPP